MAKINDTIDADTAELIAEELGHKVIASRMQMLKIASILKKTPMTIKSRARLL